MVRATRNPSDEDIASGQVDEWPGIFMDMGIQYVHYASKTDKLYHWRPECGEPKLEQPLNSMKKVKEFRQSQKNQDEDGSVVGTVAGQVAAMQTLEEAAVQSLQQMQQALPKAATTEAEHQSAQWCKEKGKAITVQSEEKPFSSLVEAHFDSNMANLREAEAVKAELKKKIKKSSGQQRHVLSSSLKKKRAEIKTMKQRMFQNVLDLHTFKPREWRDKFMQTLH